MKLMERAQKNMSIYNANKVQTPPDVDFEEQKDGNFQITDQ